MCSSSPPKPQPTPTPPQLVTQRSRDGGDAYYAGSRRGGLRVDLNDPTTFGTGLTIPTATSSPTDAQRRLPARTAFLNSPLLQGMNAFSGGKLLGGT